MNQNKFFRWRNFKSCIYTVLLLLASMITYAQDSKQVLHKRALFDPYREYMKRGVSSSDYVKDTLKLFFDDKWEKHEKQGSYFYSVAYPSNGSWICEDYDLFEKKLFNYMVYADQKLTILNGAFYTFHNNDAPEIVGRYLYNKKVGLWLTYSEDGKLNDSTYYFDNGNRANGYSFYSSDKIKQLPYWIRLVQEGIRVIMKQAQFVRLAVIQNHHGRTAPGHITILMERSPLLKIIMMTSVLMSSVMMKQVC